MPVLAFDLGGTKLAAAVFSVEGALVEKEVIPLSGRKGKEVAALMGDQIKKYINRAAIVAIGISVPGISYKTTGKVWVPNISGWDNFPLLNELKSVTDIPINIESDRACYILGEQWQGAAQNCRDAIYLAVGTGIGAGILADGRILHGANGISGAIGWMALQHPFEEGYKQYGCFEYAASGDGMVRLAEKIVAATPGYKGSLNACGDKKLTTAAVFEAMENKDPVALEVQRQCITLWGMAVANLVSLFNPEKIIIGGGVFGPAVPLIPAIFAEAKKWAQPVSMGQVELVAAELGGLSGLYGAARIALNALKEGERL